MFIVQYKTESSGAWLTFCRRGSLVEALNELSKQRRYSYEEPTEWRAIDEHGTVIA